MKNFPILTGRSFGKWRVIELAPHRNGRRHWLCQCECGSAPRAVSDPNLTRGMSTSCGCSKRRHGHTLMGIPSPTMKCYQSMLARCTQPSSPAFQHYKDRGITLCERWLNGEGDKGGFECFLLDIGERPSNSHTIERRDNDQGYEPNNCLWATRREQARNRSTTRFHEYQDGRYTIRELTEKTGIPYETLRHRISRVGVSVEQAISLGTKRPKRLTRS